MKYTWTLVAWLLVTLHSVSARSAKRKNSDANRESEIIDIDDDNQGSLWDPSEIRSEPISRSAGRNRASTAVPLNRKATTRSPLRPLELDDLLTGSGDGDNDELFIDASGDEASGDQELPTSVVCRPLPANSTSSSGGKLGAFVPRCTPDGQFEPLQCDTSHCWCVNPLDGRELKGTRRPSGPSSKRPTCSTLGLPTVVTTTTTTQPTTSATTTRLTTKASRTSASTTRLPTTKMPATTTVTSSTSRPSVSSRMPSTRKQSTVAKPVVTVRSSVAPTTGRVTAMPTSKSTSVWEPNNKIDQFPIDGADGADNELPDGTDNRVESSSDPKARKMNLRTTIIGQPGILAGIIGAAVVILLCLVLLIMFVIYRMHRKSQDPGIYYIDARKPMSNKKAGYMKALDHDVYT